MVASDRNRILANKPSGERVEHYRAWVLKAQSSDCDARNEAFDYLVRDFQGMVYSIAYRRLQDQQLAEDAAQEAFLTAYSRIAQLQDARAFPAWLRRIALSKADRLSRGLAAARDFAQEDSLPADEASPEAQVQARELRSRVRQAVAALPESQRKVTREFYLLGASQGEISQRLNLPLTTVKKRLQYARRHLRGLLSDFNDNFDRAVQAEAPRQQYQPAYIDRRRKR